jgi:hypothetical protein
VKSGQTVLLVVGISAVLLACESESARRMAARQRQLDQELSEKLELVMNLGGLRRHVEGLEKELMALRAQHFRPGPEELSRLLSGESLKKLEIKTEGNTLHLSLGGEGGAPKLVAALRALGRAEQTLVLRHITVAPPAWSAELELPAEASAPVKPRVSPKSAPSSEAPIPEPSFFETSAQEEQRVRLRQSEQKIAELDKILAEARQRKEEIEAQLRVLKAQSPEGRLVGQRPFVEALFDGPTPKLLTGVARFEADRLELSNFGQGDATQLRASLAGIGTVLQADTDIIVLGLKHASP